VTFSDDYYDEPPQDIVDEVRAQRALARSTCGTCRRSGGEHASSCPSEGEDRGHWLPSIRREQQRPVAFITTPAGVRIGSAWQPPPARLDRDQQQVQAALLEPRTAQPLRGISRVFGAIWKRL
jgi:hypothetical protein